MVGPKKTWLIRVDGLRFFGEIFCYLISGYHHPLRTSKPDKNHAKGKSSLDDIYTRQMILVVFGMIYMPKHQREAIKLSPKTEPKSGLFLKIRIPKKNPRVCYES